MSFLPPFRYMQGNELVDLIKSDAKPEVDYLVVDVRDDDYVGGHIRGGRHVPSMRFYEKVQELIEETKDVPTIVFHCYLSQQRGPKAARIYSELRSEKQEREGVEKEFTVFVLRGGFVEFQSKYKKDEMLIEGWDKDTWGKGYY